MKPSAPTAAPVRTGPEIESFDRIDAMFRDWALAWAAEEVQFPALIARTTLERAEYPEAFPHLLLSACHCRDPRLPRPALLDSDNLEQSEWLLSPAVCYHAYPRWAGLVLDRPVVLTARGRCFRHEHEFVAGRRQVEFEMREIVLGGPPEWIERRVAESKPRIAALAGQLGLSGAWEAAADPFFLPTAQGKAFLQRLQETKQEFIVPRPAPLAIASVNCHGTFFGDRFGISLQNGDPAHTACIAFGLDRWASTSNPV